MRIELVKLPKTSTKKFMVVFEDGKKVKFGAQGYSDYTIHKDKERKARYIERHSRRNSRGKSKENWTKSGIKTSGFWSRYLLWEKPTLIASVKYIEKRFHVKIVVHSP